MSMEQEQKTVQRAMDAALGGLKENPYLAQKILAKQEEKPMRMKRTAALALALSLFLVGSIALATAYLPSIKDILPWVIKEEEIVVPISQTHNSEWLDIEVTEVYFSEHGLHMLFKIDAVNENQLVVSGMDFLDKEPYNTYLDGNIHIDDWRQGKEVLLVYSIDIKHDSGWESGRRVDNTLYVESSSTSMLMRKEQVAAGITFDAYVNVQNLQTGEKEKITITLELPPLAMQEAERKNP